MSIQVKNIAGLNSYGTSIHTFGGRFDEAASDTVREFNTSLEGEKAEAINAFFEKLNKIQTTVFKDAPKDIMTYGQQVFTFTGELKGLGFSTLAYTDDESITTLTNSLEGQQRDEINGVKSKVIQTLQQAVDVMGEGDATISNFDSTVESLILEEVKSRKETHKGIKTAHEKLETDIAKSAETFESLTLLTQNAKAITSIPALNILDAIQRGDLRQDNINYLDAAYTSDDVEIIKVLISESRYKTKKDYFEKLARAKVNDASLPTTMLVANRLEKAADKGEVDGLGAFFEVLSNRDVKEVQVYTAKLSSSIDTIVDGLNAKGQSLRKPMPKDYNSKEYEEWLKGEEEAKERLKALKETSVRYGRLNNILTYMNTEKFGKVTITVKGVAQENGKTGDYTVSTKRNIKAGSFASSKTNGEYTFTIQDLGIDRKNGSETISVSSYKEQDQLKKLDKMEELRKQKDRLWMESAYNITKNIVSMNPVAGFVWNMVEAAATTKEEKNLLDDVAKNGTKALSETDFKKYKNLKKSSSHIAAGFLEHFEKAQKIQSELEKIDNDLLQQEMDTGATAIKEGKDYKHISGQSRYDFEANLRMADLQQNGLRGYYFRRVLEKEGNNVKTAVEKLETLETQLEAIEPSGDYTEEVKALFSGDGSISPEHLGGEKLVNGLKEFQNVTQDIEDYNFNYAEYGKQEDLYFNHLVGIGGN
ncbi:hypothetical protein NML63_08420 [Streptococcus sp. CF9-1]|jgi:hypothetical protein|uniref:hypothetical protein n=1 Tax=unclassified Streptococcus TaxID=2608887 RepID=UPI0020C83FF3|nr:MULTISPECIES: hypothetical protein [unclassified Streptococcus]MCP8994686.1 hypothetical protein [Streptococcus sp. CF9-3]MCP8998071.1 hypothetical protein [Streptococcus sp. CF9-1]